MVRRVNGIDVTTPTVINELFASLEDADGLTLGIFRNGMNRLFTYDLVP